MPNSQSQRAIAASNPAIETIFIVDDDSFVRSVLRAMVEENGRTVEDYESCEAFLAMYQPGRKGCLLVDAYLPGMTGLQLLRHIQRSGDLLPSIMITGNGDVNIAVEAMKAGAFDFIEKPVVNGELLKAISGALEQAEDNTKAHLLRKNAVDLLATLTAREHSILDLILAGHANKVIAGNLNISQRTVETHRAAIMKKTKSKSLSALVRLSFVATGEGKPPQNVPEEKSVEAVLAAAGSTTELDDEQFPRFFDQIPMAIVIAALKKPEVIVYANPAFENLSGLHAADLKGQPWTAVHGTELNQKVSRTLGDAIAASSDFVGSFMIEQPGREHIIVDVHSSTIEDDDGKPIYRLAALVDVRGSDELERQKLEQQLQEKDTLLAEIQHRVKNNLQMITALIRVEAKNARDRIDTQPFDRLAGRVSAIQLLYKLLSDFGKGDDIDLGIYLTEIVSTVMHSHAVEGIHLNLKVDAYSVSVNVAMPTGLVVNEVLTNMLKHAFVGRKGGTITLQSVADDVGCRVVIADDGIGLPRGVVWPTHGKLGELIVRSLRQNAKADVKVESSPDTGMRVTITFTRAASAPVATG